MVSWSTNAARSISLFRLRIYDARDVNDNNWTQLTYKWVIKKKIKLRALTITESNDLIVIKIEI